MDRVMEGGQTAAEVPTRINRGIHTGNGQGALMDPAQRPSGTRHLRWSSLRLPAAGFKRSRCTTSTTLFYTSCKTLMQSSFQPVEDICS